MDEIQPSEPLVFDTNPDETFVIIKPGAVKREKANLIINILLAAGLEIHKIKLLSSVPREQLELHYNKDLAWFLKVGERIIKSLKSKGEPITKSAEEYGRHALEEVIQHMSSGPLYILILKGKDAVNIAQELTDAIRNEFGLSIVDNAFHRSDAGEQGREKHIWAPYFLAA